MRAPGRLLRPVLLLASLSACETIDGPGSREGPLEFVWQLPTGTITAPALVVDDLVVLRQLSGRVEARRRATGVLVWRRDLPVSPSRFPARHAGGMVFVDSDALYALDLATGDVRWTRRSETTAAVQSPATADRTVYLADVSRVWALDAVTGAVRWQAEMDGFASTPVVAGGLVLVNVREIEVLGLPLRGGALVALDQATGAERWRTSAPAPTSFLAPSASAVVATDRVIVAAGSGLLRAVRLADGATLWQTMAFAPGRREAARFGDLVLVPDGGALEARSLFDGTRHWRTELLPAVDIEFTATVRDCPPFVCVALGGIVLLDPSGAVAARVPAPFLHPPVIDADGVAYGAFRDVVDGESRTRFVALRLPLGAGVVR